MNFRAAHACDAPVILVADIDRGGVFAQVVGTLEVLPPEDRKRVKGIVINRFRGDATLFADGMDYLRRRTGLPVLGLIPFFYHIEIESEDGMAVEGYEIHVGATERHQELEPAICTNDGRSEGARTPDGRLWGTYLHGLFDAGGFRQAFLRDLAPDRYKPAATDLEHTIGEFKDRQYDLLAEHFETHLDMNALMQILEGAAP